MDIDREVGGVVRLVLWLKCNSCEENFFHSINFKFTSPLPFKESVDIQH
jgi:hypothetical protein